MPTENNEVYCICVYRNQPHIEDSILTHCAKCGIEVWESVHNAGKKPICVGCVLKMPREDVELGITDEDLERSSIEIAKIEATRKRVFDNCIKYEPRWKEATEKLRALIVFADRHMDGYKRVTVEGKTYLVPIEDIICFGLKGNEVPIKYKEEVK